MKKLLIKWQRLINNDQTCPRCKSTEVEIERAYKKLKEALRIFGIKVILEKLEITPSEFNKNSLISNQIFINNKALEEWINAKTGQSPCCDVCGEQDCRTVEFLDKTYETIPETLIIKACLLAAAEILTAKPLPLKFHVEH
ncbi:MAG: DUF2703 domain-containing protein [Thermodesulfovibrio sp.]|nr:DUF2703 domain-containing protein [Thermodesulfovibrio sp.]